MDEGRQEKAKENLLKGLVAHLKTENRGLRKKLVGIPETILGVRVNNSRDYLETTMYLFELYWPDVEKIRKEYENRYNQKNKTNYNADGQEGGNLFSLVFYSSFFW